MAIVRFSSYCLNMTERYQKFIQIELSRRQAAFLFPEVQISPIDHEITKHQIWN
jgi:hypothetical protein